MTQQKPKIIVICGPTAIGKTSTAIQLAREIGGEIISADSVQIYRYMDIGTAKPTVEEIQAIPHHLIDIIDPDAPFDAALFAQKADEMIQDLTNQHKVPIVAGGTGFYIKALLNGLFEADVVDDDIRNRIRKELNEQGVAFLYHRLTKLDPITAKTIHENDTYRIIRALEVYDHTGMPISKIRSEHGFSNQPYAALKIGLTMDRETLYARINKRVDMMVEQGLLDEVKRLLAKGYTRDLKSMQTIGYRHMIEFLEKENTWDETIRTLKRDTRRYAKRQFTWFRKEAEIKWVSPEHSVQIAQMAKDFLARADTK